MGEAEGGFEAPCETHETVFFPAKARPQKHFGIAPADLAYDGFLKVWQVGEHRWEVVEKKDAVALLIYNRDRQQVVLVDQYRPAAQKCFVEAMAGHLEDCPIGRQPQLWAAEEMAREAKEELGAIIDPMSIELVSAVSLFSSPGFTTEQLWLGYVEIGNVDIEQTEKVFGLEDEGERIERIWVGLDKLACHYVAGDFIDLKTFVLVQWFLWKKLQLVQVNC